jgi:hypothetical protein
VHPVDFLLHVAAVVTIVLGTMGGDGIARETKLNESMFDIR